MSLRLEGLTAAYSGRIVIHPLSAAVERGEVVCVIGPNGSGKSTFLKAIAGLIPAGGTVRFDSTPLDSAARRRRIAYMPQDNGVGPAFTLLETVLLGRVGRLGLRLPPETVAAAQEALAAFGLDALAGRRLDEVSGGQRQLAYLAQTLFRDPDVLLLDEPTAALDIRHQLIVLKAARAHARARRLPALIAIHDITLAARFADRILCLSDGRIDAIGPPHVVVTVDRLARVYGVEAMILETLDGRLQVVPVDAMSG